MHGKVAIDKAGRMVLLKSLRDDLRLRPDDTLELLREGDTIVLRPNHPQPTLHQERGIWVYRSGRPADVSLPELIDEDRETRLRELLR